MSDDPIRQFHSANPSPLSPSDYLGAAAALRCDLAAIRAVVEVESLGHGFLPDGRPKILFERHVFHRETGGRWSMAEPAISSPQSGGYLGGAREYWRLEGAMRLDREAALRSASWGAFQIMGFNHREVGFATVEQFVSGMVASSAKQLEAFVTYIRTRRLDEALQQHRWADFAKGYNGPNYRTNRYDRRLARAYAGFAAEDAGRATVRARLQRGSRGRDVAELQDRLGIRADGIFGASTHARVTEFQRSRSLVADGVVGQLTWQAVLTG